MLSSEIILVYCRHVWEIKAGRRRTSEGSKKTLDRSVLEVEDDGLGKQDIKRLTFTIWSENIFIL